MPDRGQRVVSATKMRRRGRSLERPLVVHSFYIWHQNKPHSKANSNMRHQCRNNISSVWDDSSGLWLNKQTSQGIDVWLWVSVLQSQLLFCWVKHRERIIRSRCTSLTGSMLLTLSLTLSHVPACKRTKVIWTNKLSSDCSTGQFVADLVPLLDIFLTGLA